MQRRSGVIAGLWLISQGLLSAKAMTIQQAFPAMTNTGSGGGGSGGGGSGGTPAVLFYDEFAGTNGVTLINHTPDTGSYYFVEDQNTTNPGTQLQLDGSGRLKQSDGADGYFEVVTTNQAYNNKSKIVEIVVEVMNATVNGREQDLWMTDGSSNYKINIAVYDNTLIAQYFGTFMYHEQTVSVSNVITVRFEYTPGATGSLYVDNVLIGSGTAAAYSAGDIKFYVTNSGGTFVEKFRLRSIKVSQVP